MWEAAPVQFLTVSPGFRKTQQRVLFLLDLEPQHRYAAFIEAASDLAPTTLSSYWGAYMAAAKATGTASPMSDSRAARLLKAKAFEFVTTEPHHFTMMHMDTLLAMSIPIAAEVAVGLSFILGQRFGDVLQLHNSDILIPVGWQDPHSTFLVTFRRGKTVRTSGPFTISIPDTCPLLRRLRTNIRIIAKTEIQKQIFPPGTRAEVIAALKIVDHRLELRSLRRGGLVRLAQSSPLETVQLFSRHATKQMLLRYLSWGIYAKEQHAKMNGAITHSLM